MTTKALIPIASCRVPGNVEYLTISTTGSFAAYCSGAAEAGEVEVIDYRSATRLARFRSRRGELTFSPSSRRLAVLAGERLRCYERPWSSAPIEFPLPGGRSTLCWLDDERILAAGILDDRSCWVALVDLGREESASSRLHSGAWGGWAAEAKPTGVSTSPAGIVGLHMAVRKEGTSFGQGVDVLVGSVDADRRVRPTSRVTPRGAVHTGLDDWSFRCHLADDGRSLVCASYPRGARVFGIDGTPIGEIGYGTCTDLFRWRSAVTVVTSWTGGDHWHAPLWLAEVEGSSLELSYRAEVPIPRADAMVRAVDGSLRCVACADGELHVYELNDPDIVRLASEDGELRERAAANLGRRRHTVALVPLHERVLDPQETEQVRRAALGALASLGDDSSLPVLFRGLGIKRPTPAPAAWRDAIGEFPQDLRKRAISAGLRASALSHRRGAYRAAAAYPNGDDLDELCDGLSDHSAEIRRSAVEALGALEPLAATVPLLARLNDESEEVRSAAAAVIAAVLARHGFADAGDPPFSSDLLAAAEEVLTRGTLPGSKTAAGDRFLADLGAAIARSESSLDALLNAVEALTVPRGELPRRAHRAIGLSVALACADAMSEAGRWVAGAAIYRHAAVLAEEADAPAALWRCWSECGRCRERSGDLRGALTAYAEAMTTIDRLWFALLEEQKLRGFFRDKAALYDRACLCQLRLGHPTMAFESLERAKTRYLGDLIARRQLPARRALAPELSGFWSVVESQQPRRLSVASTGDGAHPRLALVAIDQSGPEPEGARVVPERWHAFEEALRSTENREDGWIVRGFWRVIALVDGIEDDVVRERAKGHLEILYEVAREVKQACIEGDLPLREAELAEIKRGYEAAVSALGQLDSRLGLASDLPPRWLIRIGSSREPTDQRRIDAVLEALAFALGREVVYGVSVEVDEQDPAARRLGELPIAFTAQSLEPPAGGDPRRRSTVVERTLQHHSQRRFRYVTQLTRGWISGFERVLDSLAGHPRAAHVELAVTDEGTVAFVLFGGRAGGANSGRLSKAESLGDLEIVELPGLTLTRLRELVIRGGESWFGRYRERLAGGRKSYESWLEAIETTLSRLSRELWEPIEARLSRRGVRELRMVPHRALHAIPFAALSHRGRFGHHRSLVDSYDLSYAPSFTLREIRRHRGHDSPPERDRSLVAFANPTGDLPFAATEVAECSQWWSSGALKVLPRGEATLARLRTLPAGSVLHFAGHASYDWGDPMRSALRLADAPLTLEQLFAEELPCAQADLVVLGGCETNLTDPEDLADEWLGLASGFLFAGTRAVVSTLWAVDDLASGLLLSAFYERYLGHGMSAARSLTAAQRWLRDQATRADAVRFIDKALSALDEEAATPGTGELKRILEERRRSVLLGGRRPFHKPFYWAPFVLSGF